MDTWKHQDWEVLDDYVPPSQDFKDDRVLHIKTHCKHCGALLSHTREEITGKTFVSIEVEPCSECLGTLMLAGRGEDVQT